MLLTIDIGNTSVSCGLFKNRRLAAKWKIQTGSPGYLGPLMKKLSAHTRRNIEGVIISSVSPAGLSKARKALARIFKKRPIILGGDLVVPIKNLYKQPKKVGQDRLVNALAARAFYGNGLIVIDFGTAVTFDLVTKKGEYAGGIILPGMEISFENLARCAALIPKVKFRFPKALVGRNTQESMQSGIFYGYGALCDGLVDKIKNKHGRDLKVIVTGGHAGLIRKFAENIDIVNSDLTLQGLELIYRYYKRRK